MGKVGLLTKPWHMTFKSTIKLPSIAPIWVRMHDIPLELWKETIFEKFRNSLGSFIGASDITQAFTNISYAGICVSLNLNQPLPENITVQNKLKATMGGPHKCKGGIPTKLSDNRKL